jgi:hypothetical protein
VDGCQSSSYQGGNQPQPLNRALDLQGRHRGGDAPPGSHQTFLTDPNKTLKLELTSLAEGALCTYAGLHLRNPKQCLPQCL